MDWKKTLLICLIILLVGGAVTMLIFSTEPTATQTGATQETAMLVDVTEVKQGTYQPTIEAMGTVRPAKDIILSPRVSGEIMERSEAFDPGGYVKEGETLLQIDPSDYRATLEQQRSALQQAESELALEMGQQEAARKEYEAYGDTLSEKSKALVLREPQLKSARASVKSAEAAVEQAKRDLERTTMQAPFNAHILSRNVNEGSQVGPGDDLGRLVGLDEYWVEATVPMSKLAWLSLPQDENAKGSEVRIRDRTAWAEDDYRTGFLHKVVGSLDEQTRMARVLITVPDPQAYQDENAGLPRLMIGSYVETNIQGEELSDVVRLNRDYIRSGETVWVMEDQQLQIRDVNIVLSDAQYAYIDSGLEDNEQVVTTNLTNVTDGAPLRLQETEIDTTERDIQ